MIGVISTVESSNFRGLEGLAMKSAAAIFLAKRWMLCEQTKSDEQVRLSTTHSLLQMKHGLRRSTGEARDAFAKEILHSLGYMRLFEKRGPVTLRMNQIIELLNLIAEFDGQGGGLKFTCWSPRLKLTATYEI